MRFVAVLRPQTGEEEEELRRDYGEARRDWALLHEGYYGTPHGATRVSEYAAEANPHGAAADVPCGYAAWCGGAQWVRNSGNYCRLDVTADGLRVSVGGRRHGIQWHAGLDFLSDHWADPTRVEVVEYLTREPEWLPWETADDHEDHEAPAS